MRLSAGRLMLGLALAICAAVPASAQGWEKFSPEGGGFSVTLPGKPTADKQEVPTKIGTLINHTFMVESGQSVYMVSYSDFPEPVSDPAVVKAMLDSARDNAVANTQGKLKEEKEIKLGGHPGREWLVDFPSGRARARAYWVGKRLYQAVVLMPAGADAAGEQAREATMSKFLDSFALTDTGEPR